MKISFATMPFVLGGLLLVTPAASRADHEPCDPGYNYHDNLNMCCQVTPDDNCYTPFPAGDCTEGNLFNQAIYRHDVSRIESTSCGGGVVGCSNEYTFRHTNVWVCHDGQWRNRCSKSSWEQVVCSASSVECENCNGPAMGTIYMTNSTSGGHNSCQGARNSLISGNGAGTSAEELIADSYLSFYDTVAKANAENDLLEEIISTANLLITSSCDDPAPLPKGNSKSHSPNSHN